MVRLKKEGKKQEITCLLKQKGPIDLLIHLLAKWISMRTVSGNPRYLEECRRGARFFKNTLQQLGAKSQLVSGYFFLHRCCSSKLLKDSWCNRKKPLDFMPSFLPTLPS